MFNKTWYNKDILPTCTNIKIHVAFPAMRSSFQEKIIYVKNGVQLKNRIRYDTT